MREFVSLSAAGIVEEHFKSEPGMMALSEPEESIDKELREKLYEPTISVAKFADVTTIPNDKVDDRIRNNSFEYYRADLGMNILVPKGKIKSLRFKLDILGDDGGDVYAISGFPNDVINTTNIVKGKIQLSINKMLKIIPMPVGPIIGDLVDVELDPWVIDWSYDKLQVGFTEGLTDQLEWFLSADNVNQSFTCYITLKKQNTIKKVKGIASAIWEYEPPKDLQERIREKFGKNMVTLHSEQKEIKII